MTPVARLLVAAVRQKQRSFHLDAQACVSRLDPPVQVHGREHIPTVGPCLLTLNHYSRPGFYAWWLALAVSAAVPAEVHWIVTSAWTFEGRRRGSVLKPVTRWALRHIARVYGFSLMPPMPPDPGEARARAESVRQVLAYARRAERPLIGLAPEGRDFLGGRLGWPPPGAGRFVLHLADMGLPVLPIGVYEAGALCLRFGPRYQPRVPAGLRPDARDRAASRIVMENIARLLPQRLRGEFA